MVVTITGLLCLRFPAIAMVSENAFHDNLLFIKYWIHQSPDRYCGGAP